MHFLLSDMLSCHVCMNWSFNLSLSMFLNVLTEHGKDCVHLIDDNQSDLKILNSSNLYNKVCETLLWSSLTSLTQYEIILALISISTGVIPNSPYTILEQVDLLTARIYLQNLSCNFSKMSHSPSFVSLTATSTGKESLLFFLVKRT